MAAKEVKVGQRVVHGTFGAGKVMRRIERFVVINFDRQDCPLAVLPATLRPERQSKLFVAGAALLRSLWPKVEPAARFEATTHS
jgi:hypothetical protein